MYGVCYVRIDNRIEIVVTFVYPVCKKKYNFPCKQMLCYELFGGNNA